MTWNTVTKHNHNIVMISWTILTCNSIIHAISFEGKIYFQRIFLKSSLIFHNNNFTLIYISLSFTPLLFFLHLSCFFIIQSLLCSVARLSRHIFNGIWTELEQTFRHWASWQLSKMSSVIVTKQKLLLINQSNYNYRLESPNDQSTIQHW